MVLSQFAVQDEIHRYRPKRIPSMNSIENEMVLVVPSALIKQQGYFQGFTSEVDRYLPFLMRAEAMQFRPRHEVEHDPEFKQLIPYVIFRHKNSPFKPTIFQYTRGSKQDESRLRNKRSIGIGGHISILDASTLGTGSAYEEGMRRELDEEVQIDTKYSQECVGLINDDQTEVGKVHLGIVHIFDVIHPTIHPRENEITESSFCPVGELLEDISSFESWSQICIDSLFRSC
jgi:predicted NUDIX family phosphoesterase